MGADRWRLTSEPLWTTLARQTRRGDAMTFRGKTAFIKAGEYSTRAELEADIDRYIG